MLRIIIRPDHALPIQPSIHPVLPLPVLQVHHNAISSIVAWFLVFHYFIAICFQDYLSCFFLFIATIYSELKFILSFFSILSCVAFLVVFYFKKDFLTFMKCEMLLIFSMDIWWLQIFNYSKLLLISHFTYWIYFVSYLDSSFMLSVY